MTLAIHKDDVITVEEVVVIATNYLTMITAIRHMGEGKRNLVICNLGERNNKVYWCGDKIVAMEDMPTPENPKYTYYVSKEILDELKDKRRD